MFYNRYDKIYKERFSFFSIFICQAGRTGSCRNPRKEVSVNRVYHRHFGRRSHRAGSALHDHSNAPSRHSDRLYRGKQRKSPGKPAALRAGHPARRCQSAGRKRPGIQQKIRGEGYEGQIIINTAYAQFEYAQSAVQIKAFDYLLKPCNPQRISDVLTACVNKLNLDESARQQQSRINQFSDSYIFEHLALGDPHLLPRLETIGWPCDGAFQALVLDFRTPGLESPIPPLHAIYHKALFLYQRTEPGHVLLVVQPRRALSCMQLRAVINLCALTGLKRLSTAQLCLVSPVCTTLEALAHQIHDLPAQPPPQGKKQIPVHFLSPAPA